MPGSSSRFTCMESWFCPWSGPTPNLEWQARDTKRQDCAKAFVGMGGRKGASFIWVLILLSLPLILAVKVTGPSPAMAALNWCLYWVNNIQWFRKMVLGPICVQVLSLLWGARSIQYPFLCGGDGASMNQSQWPSQVSDLRTTENIQEIPGSSAWWFFFPSFNTSLAHFPFRNY